MMRHDGPPGVPILIENTAGGTNAMTRHLEYAVDLIGIDHVGVSTDHSFDADDFLAEIQRMRLDETEAAVSV